MNDSRPRDLTPDEIALSLSASRSTAEARQTAPTLKPEEAEAALASAPPASPIATPPTAL
ncbi:MAG TPA: hypothetical protein VGB69_13015 [Edaphobacter sp.]